MNEPLNEIGIYFDITDYIDKISNAIDCVEYNPQFKGIILEQHKHNKKMEEKMINYDDIILDVRLTTARTGTEILKEPSILYCKPYVYFLNVVCRFSFYDYKIHLYAINKNAFENCNELKYVEHKRFIQNDKYIIIYKLIFHTSFGKEKNIYSLKITNRYFDVVVYNSQPFGILSRKDINITSSRIQQVLNEYSIKDFQ